MFKKSWYLFLVLFIEGAALMAVELMGAKLVAPFYGSSLYVWTAVLAITVLGLTLGYYFGGQLSGKQYSEKLLFIVLGISALLVFALPHTASFLILLTSGLDLITGICVTCLLLLLPPMLCFGIVGPIVVRLMAISLETLGSVAGTVYFTSTLGGILATFLFGYYLIPEAGLKFCALVTAVALASLIVVYIIRLLLSRKQENIVQKDTQEKDRIKSGALKKEKIKSSIYLFAVLEGATVMAVELIAARMIAPYFGSSLYVWAAVIGFTLLGLAMGYYLGGRLADKYWHPNTILWVLLAASVFLMLMHYTSAQLTNLFVGMNIWVSVIIICMLLVLPPLLFLGMVPTLLIRYISATVDDAGKATGNVFTISSASGIIALLVIGFYIIPQFGLTIPSIITGIIVGSFPFLKLVLQRKYIAFVFLACVIVSLSLKRGEQSSGNVDVQYYSEGLLGQVLVADVSYNHNGLFTTERVLFTNRIGETFIDKKTGNTTSDYLVYVTSLASKLPENSNALLLGLGGGSIANILHDGLKFNVDAAELDERIVDVAKNYFQLNKDVNVYIDDARHYVEKTNKKYDLIFFDAFRGDYPPAHVYSVECYKKAKSLLNKNGLIIVNFFGFINGDIGKAGRSIYKTLRAAGLETKILPTTGKEDERNLLYVASAEPQNFTHIKYPLELFKKQVDIDTLFLDTKNSDINNAVIFTDDKPILDRLSIEVTNIFRKSYDQTYTKSFAENGVPLFK